MARIQHDVCGPAQALAKAVIDLIHGLLQRNNNITVRWTPAHLGVEGNGHADAVAKRAAEGKEGRVNPKYLGEASLSHLTRKITEDSPGLPGSGSEIMSEGNAAIAPRREGSSARDWARFERSWQDASISSCQAMQPRFPICDELARPLTISAGGVAAANNSRATTFSSTVGAGHQKSDGCGRESRRNVSGSPPGPPPSASSSETPAVLEFLEDTRVGRMPGLALMGVCGRRSQAWTKLGYGPRWKGKKGQTRMVRRVRRVGQAHPKMYLTSFLCSFFLFCYVSRGCRVAGGDTYHDGASSSGVGQGYLEKPTAVMALRAACSGL